MIAKIFKYTRRLIPYSIKKHIATFRYRIFNIFSVVIIETSSACNRRCSYCPNSKYDRGLIKNNKKLKTELYHKIINELAELKWFGQIQFNFYNEPLMDERLPELIKYARFKLPASSLAVYTNGDLLTVDLYKILVGSGMTDLIITEHEQKASDNIDKFLELSKSDDHVKVVHKRLKRFNSRGGLIKLLTEEYKPECLWPIHDFIVNHEGEAVLCCNDYFNSVKLGNVEHEKIMDIWNNPRYKQIRKDLSKRVFRYEICKKCVVGEFAG